MLVTGFLEKNSTPSKKSTFFKKCFLISLAISFLFIVIALFLLFLDTQYIYGVLVGVGANFISLLLILLLKKLIDKEEKNIYFSLVVLTIRVLVFAGIFCFILFFINPLIFDEQGVKLLLEPINLFAMLLAYEIHLFSIIATPIIEWFFKKN